MKSVVLSWSKGMLIDNGASMSIMGNSKKHKSFSESLNSRKMQGAPKELTDGDVVKGRFLHTEMLLFPSGLGLFSVSPCI